MAQPVDAIMIKQIKAAKAAAKKAYVNKANAELNKYTGSDAWLYPLASALAEMMTASLVAQEPAYVGIPLNADGEAIRPVMEKMLTHYSHMLDMRTRALEAAEWGSKTSLAVGKVGYAELGGDSSSNIMGQFWIETLDPRLFFVDPNCTKTDLSDARFCGDTVKIPKIEALNNDRYNPEVINRLQPSVPVEYNERHDETYIADAETEYSLIDLDELHYRNLTGGIDVGSYGAETNDPAREMSALPPEWRWFNYVPLVLFPIPGKFYGQSMTARIMAVCDDLDGAFKRIADRWAHAPEKIFVNENALAEKDGTDRVTSDKMWDVIPVREGSASEAAHIMHGQAIFPDEQNWIQFLIQMFQYISGMTEMQLGAATKGTATEMSLIKQASDMRSAHRMNQMERWVATIGMRLWTMIRWAFRQNKIPALEILGNQELVDIWTKYEERQSDREKVMQDTDLVVRMSLPINAAAVHRRDKNLEFLRISANPDVMQVLAAQGKMVNYAAIIQKIGDDTNMGDGIIQDIPQQAQTEQQGGAQ